MREIDIDIKFRFWDKKQKLMNPVGMIDFDNHRVFSLTWVEYLDYVLMQYTGLKDKNGKEMWEGDINLDYDNRISEVVFYAGGFYFKYSEIEYKHIGSFAPFNFLIIGNIFENPELLEGKNSGE